MTKNFINKSKIRSKFLKELSNMYSKELPEYRQFVDIVDESNRKFIKNNPNIKVDNIDRVIEERHGAIRVGSAKEMNIIAQIFDLMGMQPVNFYDLTAVKKPMPVISTAFRPKTSGEIEQSAFRMFCSMLFLDDERFFTKQEKKIAQETLAKRNIFSKELLNILDIAKKQGGLDEKQSDILIKQAAKALKMDDKQVIDFNLYKNFIINGNDVAADIICFKTIHINHLTPRVYDIFDIHKRLQNLGIPTINNVQGPLRRQNEQALPLLNQTSRKAPGEFIYATIDQELSNNKIQNLEESGKIKKIEPNENEDVKDYLNRVENILNNQDVKIVKIKHKARFGEIECRGVALTPKGREIYDKMMQDGSYINDYPKTHQELFEKEYAYYEFELIKEIDKKDQSKTLIDLVKLGYVELLPITYEDFLPKSAAGIFESNLSGKAKEMQNSNLNEEKHHQEILENAIGKKIINCYELYEDISNNSRKNIF